MKIDYSKSAFTQDERRYMFNETQRLQETNPNYIPVLIQLDSNVLKIEKQKFLVSNDINFNDFITNTLKKKLINLYSNDILVSHTVNFSGPNKFTYIKPHSNSMREVYDQHKDPETNLLIFKVSRMTTYKYLKTSAAYWMGY
jgi:hypothetical protein